jgi:predicted dithiol-disulfide oxidoreductase (DUF899 family)
MITNLTERSNIVPRAEWLAARKELLTKEKQLTRQRDEIDRQRRALPWVKVEKNYIFEGPNGQQSLADLFENRSQLIVCRTSCSVPAGRRAVWAAPSAPITSTAR